jgi:hypothetical protein
MFKCDSCVCTLHNSAVHNYPQYDSTELHVVNRKVFSRGTITYCTEKGIVPNRKCYICSACIVCVKELRKKDSSDSESETEEDEAMQTEIESPGIYK